MSDKLINIIAKSIFEITKEDKENFYLVPNIIITTSKNKRYVAGFTFEGIHFYRRALEGNLQCLLFGEKINTSNVTKRDFIRKITNYVLRTKKILLVPYGMGVDIKFAISDILRKLIFNFKIFNKILHTHEYTIIRIRPIREMNEIANRNKNELQYFIILPYLFSFNNKKYFVILNDKIGIPFEQLAKNIVKFSIKKMGYNSLVNYNWGRSIRNHYLDNISFQVCHIMITVIGNYIDI